MGAVEILSIYGWIHKETSNWTVLNYVASLREGWKTRLKDRCCPSSCPVGKSIFGTKDLEEIQITEELQENKYNILIYNQLIVLLSKIF